MARVLALVGALILVAGCSVPDKRQTPQAFRAMCVYDVCTVDPASPDAQSALTLTGLHMVLVGGAYEGLELESNLLVWQGPSLPPDQHSTILGYDLKDNRLIDIGRNPDAHFTQPHISNGYVAYSVGPALGLWDSRTETHRPLHPPVKGDLTPYSFDYPWVGFINFGNGSSAGVWVINVASNASFQIESVKHDRPVNRPSGVAVARGNAYVTVNRGNGSYEITETNLTDKTSRIIYSMANIAIQRPVADHPYLAWEETRNVDKDRIRLMDLRTRETIDLFSPEKGGSNFPAIGGGWVLAQRHSPLLGHHIETSKEFVLANRTANFFPLGYWATDGKQVFLQATLSGKAFEADGAALFWRDLPNV